MQRGRMNRLESRARTQRLESLERRQLLAAHVAGDPTVYATIQAAVDAAVIQRNVFRNNNLDGPHSGRGIYSDGSYSGGTLVNVTIDSNFFYNNCGGKLTSTTLEAAISLQARSVDAQSDIRITNNVFD